MKAVCMTNVLIGHETIGGSGHELFGAVASCKKPVT